MMQDVPKWAVTNMHVSAGASSAMSDLKKEGQKRGVQAWMTRAALCC
jgi:hypothetical protein